MQEKACGLLLAWYDGAKRDLPWRGTRDPYQIWISEIMLQQTRVETVKDYYLRFMALFPTIADLAKAPLEAVLKAWEGLGYYSRARNLQKAAQTVENEKGGAFPTEYEQIVKLSGIGPYTAGAIASIAFEERVPAIDGNVYRVASRFFGVRADIGRPSVQRDIRVLVHHHMPTERVGDFNQAMMELGATHCSPRSPTCDCCPWNALCDACAEGDADHLPIHEKKSPPKVLDVAVCLLTYEKQALVMRRNQRLLQGLFVFDLIEEEVEPTLITKTLAQQGFACLFVDDLGAARHVFTHRIWEMQILHYQLKKRPDVEVLAALDAHMADVYEIARLPFPTAMKVAKKHVIALLTEE